MYLVEKNIQSSHIIGRIVNTEFLFTIPTTKIMHPVINVTNVYYLSEEEEEEKTNSRYKPKEDENKWKDIPVLSQKGSV